MPKQKAKAPSSVLRTSPQKSSLNNKPKSLITSKQTARMNKQESKVERLRNFLSKNKIYFETLAATTLTVMAIVVAFAQLLITYKQTVYLEQQTTIGRSQALPHFVITAKQFMNEDNTLFVSDKILVYNQGNIAYNITAETAVFFEMSYRDGIDLLKKQIPISGYYTVKFISGDATGLVITIDSYNNNLKYSKIESDLRELSKENENSILIDVKRYIKLSYRDIFNESHTEYYFVPLIYGSTLLDETEGETIFAEYKKNLGYMLDLDRMTAEDLINLFP